MGKKVIAIDLNPLSRTARMASITIVDSVIRAFPLLIKYARTMKSYSRDTLEEIVKKYDNKTVLTTSLRFIAQRLSEISL